MSSLRSVAEEYLRMRRALGYKLETPGRQLEKFVGYLEQTGAQTVTIENAVAWAQSAGVDPGYWGQRLSVVRQFARHLQTIDPACELPPPRILPSRSRRAIPYPYTPQEIATLMSAAGGLPSPLMAATYPTVLGLLTVSGMRIGEAIGLDRDNVDARHGLLRVINSKSQRAARCRCRRAQCRRSMRTADGAISCARGRPARRSFSQPRAPGFMPPISTGRSPGSSGRSVSPRARRAADRGCMIKPT